jgi:DNA-binding NarL/FixJ family response regulator
MSEAQPISVAVVEDDPQVRESLVTILRRASGMICMGAYATAEESLVALPSLHPQVVLMDISLPGMDGVECVRRLSAICPETQIIMLTVYDQADTIFNSLAAGASGYLLKPVRASELVNAVKDVHAGGAPMTSNIARRVVQVFQQRLPARDPAQELSDREREVLRLLAEGYLYKEIAGTLGIGYGTVHTYVARIYKKLHVRSRSEAVVKYLGGGSEH